MNFPDSCEKWFGTRNLYEIMNLPNTASAKEVRKAYHTLSLACHPDKVSEAEREDATEKFKILCITHSILSDPEKRSIYDETGLLPDGYSSGSENAETQETDWKAYWRTFFKKVTVDDIDKYEEEYKGSEQELEDLKDAYIKTKGNFDKILEYIMFASAEDEDRLRALIQGLIDTKEVPEFEAFTQEAPEKRERRLRKMRNEAKAAKKAKDEMDSLEKAIKEKNRGQSSSFLEALEKKYANPKKSKNGKTGGSSKK